MAMLLFSGFTLGRIVGERHVCVHDSFKFGMNLLNMNN